MQFINSYKIEFNYLFLHQNEFNLPFELAALTSTYNNGFAHLAAVNLKALSISS